MFLAVKLAIENSEKPRNRRRMKLTLVNVFVPFFRMGNTCDMYYWYTAFAWDWQFGRRNEQWNWAMPNIDKSSICKKKNTTTTTNKKKKNLNSHYHGSPLAIMSHLSLFFCDYVQCCMFKKALQSIHFQSQLSISSSACVCVWVPECVHVGSLLRLIPLLLLNVL